MPDEFVEIVPILVVASLAVFRGEIILVPPLVFDLWRQRDLAGCLSADQITAHRNDSLAAFWPEHGDVIRAPQSKPAIIALSILSASIKWIMSRATTEGWPFRTVSLERNLVVPDPRKYGTITW